MSGVFQNEILAPRIFFFFFSFRSSFCCSWGVMSYHVAEERPPSSSSSHREERNNLKSLDIYMVHYTWGHPFHFSFFSSCCYYRPGGQTATTRTRSRDKYWIIRWRGGGVFGRRRRKKKGWKTCQHHLAIVILSIVVGRLGNFSFYY